MPLDKFFTSETKVHEWPARVPRIRKGKIEDSHDSELRKFRKKRRRGRTVITGRDALTGFRPPKKVWDAK